MKTLEQTLQYENPQLALRIQRVLRCSRKEALELYEDLLRWLWLCGRQRGLAEKDAEFRKRIPDTRMLDHFKAIDFAWHEFILMTKDYEDFCHHYCDRFLHHTPGLINRGTLARRRKGRIAGSRYLKNYFSFIYDELGEKCFDRWMNEVPKIRTPR